MTQSQCSSDDGVGASGKAKTGIPTLYSGVLMRSRLEARWAALFDHWGWPWRYEPQDLPGYCPDFIVDFHHPVLAEVKAAPDEYAAAIGKIELSGWRGEALLVSSVIDGSSIGRFGANEVAPDGTQRVWGEARIFYCISCGRISVLPEHSDWTCRVCGDGNGNAHVGEYDPAFDWIEAGNRVQWRAH